MFHQQINQLILDNDIKVPKLLKVITYSCEHGAWYFYPTNQAFDYIVTITMLQIICYNITKYIARFYRSIVVQTLEVYHITYLQQLHLYFYLDFYLLATQLYHCRILFISITLFTYNTIKLVKLNDSLIMQLLEIHNYIARYHVCKMLASYIAVSSEISFVVATPI